MRWILEAIDEEEVRAVAEAAALPFPLARVLVQRGLRDPVEIKAFLSPRLANLSDPFRLPAMDRAVERIWRAIDNDEAITVFGDYDVDGVTSCALMTQALRELGARAQGFIPDRLDEGYGLSADALARCSLEQAPRLLITVDCGTNSVESVARAQADGLDVVVLDHHEPLGTPVDPYALVNPRLELASDPDGLAGVGVVFKTVHALLKAGREAGRTVAQAMDLCTYMDLVALGTVADIVPLSGENRILVWAGLRRINGRSPRVGLSALKKVAGVQGEVEASHLGFQLGPRINAAGRIGEPMTAFALLSTEDRVEAKALAERLDATNRERRALENRVLADAVAQIDTDYCSARDIGLVVAGLGWHPGVVGIVASRVVRHYHRPAVVLSIDEAGRARGSCRSIASFDLMGGLRACSDLLIKYGGHRMAAGVELEAGAIASFREAFNAAARCALTEEDLEPKMQLDAVLPLEQVDAAFMAALSRLAPFGEAHREPLWLVPAVQVEGHPKVLAEKHLKFVVTDGTRTLEAIAFNRTEPLPSGLIDLACTVQANRWNGREAIQLNVRAVRSTAGKYAS